MIGVSEIQLTDSIVSHILHTNILYSNPSPTADFKCPWFLIYEHTEEADWGGGAVMASEISFIASRFLFWFF
jgi:hypothetical protein